MKTGVKTIIGTMMNSMKQFQGSHGYIAQPYILHMLECFLTAAFLFLSVYMLY